MSFGLSAPDFTEVAWVMLSGGGHLVGIFIAFAEGIGR